MPEPRPAQQIIDTLLWERLGSFWTERYDTSDRLALSSVYEAASKVLDGEMVRAIEIDRAKSVISCPVYSQRRWLRLDLGRYAEMRAWLRFLAGAGLPTGDVTSSGATQLLCEDSTAHPRHWHIRFPWDSRAQGTTIRLGYRISPELIEGWRSDGTAGAFGTDFSIAAGGTSIEILRDDAYDFTVAMDFSAPAYNAVHWTQIRAGGLSGADTVPVPDGFGQGSPIHALIVHNPPDGTTSSFFSSNSASFSTTTTFVPSAEQLSTGNLRVPGVAAGDVVLLFGLVAGAAVQTHTHQIVAAVLPGSAPISSWTPNVAVGAAVLYGTPGMFGHEIRLYRDGRLMSPTTYSYDQPTNTFFFPSPLSNAGGTLNFDVEWTEDSLGGVSHRHYACASAIVSTKTDFTRFDDGGAFDDGGFFDETTTSSVATLSFAVELTTSTVFANGILLSRGQDYSAAIVGSTTVLTFGVNIPVADVVVHYRRDSLPFSYGGLDIPRALPAAAVSNLSSDLANVSEAFFKQFGSTLRNIALLVESANVLAAGGNPLLSLFTDEWPEYNGLPVDQANAAIDSATARAVESAQTELIDIPYMQDRVLNPTVRLHAGIDYQVVSGAVESVEDLTLSRGPGDATPGIWWCPLVVLDERMLAKNFGALVGDEQDSSDAYRGLLIANLNLRYGGPTPQNVRAAVSAYAGSAIVTADAVVTGERTEISGRVVTITANSGAQQSADVATTSGMVVGIPVAAGQSLAQPLSFAGLLTGIISFGNGELQLSPPNPAFVPGATVRLALTDDYGSFVVQAVSTETQALRDVQHIIFTASTPQALSAAPLAAVFLPGPGPFAAFDGTVTGVTDTVKKFLTTTAGDYPLVQASVWEAGHALSRGQAVEPFLTTILADDTTPNWYKQKPPTAVQLASIRHVVITPGLNIATAVFTPAYPALARETTVDINNQRYTVLGQHDGIATVTPAIAAIGDAVITPPVDPALSHYEFAVIGVSSLAPGIVATNAPSVALVSASAFPPAGRVAVVDVNGLRVTFAYKYKDGNILRGLTWGEAGSISNGTAYAVSELKEARLHPAFATLAQQRLSTGVSLSLGDPTTDLIYNLLKANALVIETKTPARPAALRLLLEETLPAHISATLHSTHTVNDVAFLDGVDRGTAPPSFTIVLSTVETPGPTTQALSFKSAPVYAATPNAPAVLADWNASSFGWTARVSGGPSTTLSISTPHGKTTQIFGFVPGGTYTVTLKVVTLAGVVHTSSLSIVC